MDLEQPKPKAFVVMRLNLVTLIDGAGRSLIARIFDSHDPRGADLAVGLIIREGIARGYDVEIPEGYRN